MAFVVNDRAVQFFHDPCLDAARHGLRALAGNYDEAKAG